MFLERDFSKEKVRDRYSRIADIYDLWSHFTESKAANRVIELAQIKDGERILEVAVGTGLIFEEIIKRNKTGMNVGVDISPGMLSRAKYRAEKINAEHCHLQLGDAYQLAFKSDTFDLVVNSYMFDLLPEKDFVCVLSEFHRVLKPSGRVVISSMTLGQKKCHRIWDWLADHYPSLLLGCRPVSIQDYLPKAGFGKLEREYVSQYSFPSEIIRAEKG